MKYYSTNRSVHPVSFREALIKGLPDDNGLFMPNKIPSLPEGFLDDLYDKNLQEIGFSIAQQFVEEEIPEEILQDIINETLNFPVPVVNIHDHIYALELFHGPTCAFKDVGARFLARCLNYLSEDKVTVLVATSGDTGSAVANGFLGLPNVDVVILYPSGKVSHLQEQQLTTLGQNITAIEVDGTFDDCQQMVKSAFLDKELNDKIQLTSANSINIARLIPQSFYYFWALAQLKTDDDVIFSVPSGNYGNLTAGLMAKAMGLNIAGFIASSNINDIVPKYISSEIFEPKPSRPTISNAMDVGNPSNFYRMLEVYESSWDKITTDVSGYSFTDEQTRQAIKEVHREYQYVLDPHGAVGYLGLKNHLKKKNARGIFLETAHPAKFHNVIEPITGKIDMPDRLEKYLHLQKKSIPMANEFGEFKRFLLAK